MHILNDEEINGKLEPWVVFDDRFWFKGWCRLLGLLLVLELGCIVYVCSTISVGFKKFLS